MKNVGVIVVAVAFLSAAAERQWQTGTCVDVGVKHDARVGGGTADFGPFTRQRIPRGTLPEVATYVIETDTQRIETQEVQPIGPESLKMSVGDHVVFALDKKTAYVRDAKETEHRLLVTKKITKPKP